MSHVPLIRESCHRVYLESVAPRHNTALRAPPLAPSDARLYLQPRDFLIEVCCSVLQCVAVCCSVLQCVAVSLQCVAVCCSVLQCVAVCCGELQRVAVCCSVLQCSSVLQCLLQCITVCCSVLQRVFQCVAVCRRRYGHLKMVGPMKYF